MWDYWKPNELPNLCYNDFTELRHEAPCALRRMRRHPTLVGSFWKQDKLF